jgi:hypothetical protein
MSSRNFKRGDVAGYVFAQPGNDTTFVLLTEVRDEDADAWDLMFEMEVNDLKLDKLWPASDREMESSTMFIGGDRSGSFSVRQLADEYRNKMGIFS